MCPFVFSIYYPHKQKCQLVKYAVLPLMKMPELESFNYFFSLYKGENMTIQVVCRNKEMIQRQVRTHFKTFFKIHGVRQKEIKLPVNQLFLDFEFNSIHFWEHNPFKSETMLPERSNNRIYNYALSRQCLLELASEQQWDDASSFQVFIDLFTVLKVMWEQKKCKSANSIFTNLITDLKKRSGGQEHIFEKFMSQGKGIYRQNQSDIDLYFQTTKLQIEDNSQMPEKWISDWVSIIRQYPQPILDNPDFRIVSKVIQELILNISSKIDLGQKGLVQALSVVSGLIGQRGAGRSFQ